MRALWPSADWCGRDRRPEALRGSSTSEAVMKSRAWLVRGGPQPDTVMPGLVQGIRAMPNGTTVETASSLAAWAAGTRMLTGSVRKRRPVDISRLAGTTPAMTVARPAQARAIHPGAFFNRFLRDCLERRRLRTAERFSGLRKGETAGAMPPIGPSSWRPRHRKALAAREPLLPVRLFKQALRPHLARSTSAMKRSKRGSSA